MLSLWPQLYLNLDLLQICSWRQTRWQMRWTTGWRWRSQILSCKKMTLIFKCLRTTFEFQGVGGVWRAMWWGHTGRTRDQFCWDGQGIWIPEYPYIWSEKMFQGCRPGDNFESLRQFFVLPGWRLDGFGRCTRGQAADLPLWKPAWWRAAHTMISQLTAHCDNANEQVVPTHSSLYTIRAHTMRLKPSQSELLHLLLSLSIWTHWRKPLSCCTSNLHPQNVLN